MAVQNTPPTDAQSKQVITSTETETIHHQWKLQNDGWIAFTNNTILVTPTNSRQFSSNAYSIPLDSITKLAANQTPYSSGPPARLSYGFLAIGMVTAFLGFIASAPLQFVFGTGSILMFLLAIVVTLSGERGTPDPETVVTVRYSEGDSEILRLQGRVATEVSTAYRELSL